MNPEKFCTTGDGKNRCLCCLPVELLQLILSRLSILDYLFCRSVCKCWRFAFSQGVVSFEDQTDERSPWVVFVRVNEGIQPIHYITGESVLQLMSMAETKPPMHTVGKLGNSFTGRVHVVPELSDKLFLLSRYGWLLLCSSSSENPPGSLFFFNPFSRARIHLPFLDVPSLENTTFAMSSPPESPHCMVFVIRCFGNQMGGKDIDISICRRGDDAWTTRTYHGVKESVGFVVNVVFSKGVFYCVHQGGHLSAFSVENRSWSHLMGPEYVGPTRFRMINSIISHEDHDGSEVLMHIESPNPCVRVNVKLKDPLEFSPPCCFNEFEASPKYQMLVNPKKAFLSLGNMFSLDSFTLEYWYGLCEFVDEGSKFNFRPLEFWPSVIMRTRESMTVAWLKTKWVQPSQSLSWTTKDCHFL